MNTTWVYIHSEHSSEHNLYTVGFYDPNGKFQPDSDHSTKEEAGKRVHFLNGGTLEEETNKVREMVTKVRAAAEEKVTEDNPFTQLCVWPACVVGKEKIAEFEAFMTAEFNGTRVKYAEEVLTLPDVENGKAVPDTGGRNDLFFYAHSEDLGKFAVPRLAYGIRWWEDVLDNGGGILYPPHILKKYPYSWDTPGGQYTVKNRRTD